MGVVVAANTRGWGFTGNSPGLIFTVHSRAVAVYLVTGILHPAFLVLSSLLWTLHHL